MLLPLFIAACGNSRAEEALQAYEKLADELVEARKNGDYARTMEITVELKTLQVEYSDIRADRDLNDDQRKRLAEVMRKIISGDYQEMMEKTNERYMMPLNHR